MLNMTHPLSLLEQLANNRIVPLSDLIRRASRGTLRPIPKPPTATRPITCAGLGISTTIRSIGLGNIIRAGDFSVDRRLPTRTETWAGRIYLRSPTRTIWGDHNENSARQKGCA